jgi:hypothetical protein
VQLSTPVIRAHVFLRKAKAMPMKGIERRLEVLERGTSFDEYDLSHVTDEHLEALILGAKAARARMSALHATAEDIERIERAEVILQRHYPDLVLHLANRELRIK